MPKHHTLVGIQSSQAAWRILATTIERLISVSKFVEDFEGDGDVKRKEVAGSQVGGWEMSWVACGSRSRGRVQRF